MGLTGKLAFWKSEAWQKRSKSIRLVTGLAVLVFAIFSLLAVLSYFGTWKLDASLAYDASEGEPVHNMAGTGGWKWAHFLVGTGFGLASLLVLVALFALGIRMVVRRWKFPLGATLFFCLSGAFVFSVALGYVGSLLPADNAFGGGLGGEFGASFVALCTRRIGRIVTILLTVGLVAAWVFLLVEEGIRPLLADLRSRGKQEPEEAGVPEVEQTEMNHSIPVSDEQFERWTAQLEAEIAKWEEEA